MSDNVYADLGFEKPDEMQEKAAIASEIMGLLEKGNFEVLSVETLNIFKFLYIVS